MTSRWSARPQLVPLEGRLTPTNFFDLGYGTNGIAPLAGPSALTTITDFAASPDGSAVVAGYDAQATGARDFLVFKLTPAGRPDPAFGTNSRATVSFDLLGPGQGDDAPAAVAPLADGRVVVVGTAAAPGGGVRVAVARLTPAGALDPSFDGDGRLTFAFDPAAPGANALLGVGVRPDGSVVITGFGSQAVAVRLAADGSRDADYGMPSLGADVAAAAVDPDGRVLVAHRAGTPIPNGLRNTVTASRLDAAGLPDLSYGGDGEAEVGAFDTDNFATRGSGVSLVPLAAGDTLVSFDTQTGSVRVRASVVSRLDPAGVLDSEFAGGGTLTALEGFSIRQDASGRLLGFPTGGSFSPPRTVQRRSADGTPDATFGDGGQIDLADLSISLHGVTPLADGTVLVAGVLRNPTGAGAVPNYLAGLARLLPAGNQSPAVAAPPVATTGAGEPAGFLVTVSDPDTAADDLTVTADPDNPTLFPAGSVTVSGSGTSRSVALVPAPGRSGEASVVVTVRDPFGATATAVVRVAVLPLPSALGGVTRFAAGPGAGGRPVAGVYTADGSAVRSTSVFQPGFTGGVRVAAADLTGDGVPDLVVGTGPGSATRVEVYDGVSFARVFATDPFEASFTGGVFVAAGDLTGDGRADLVISPDEGGGPRVRVFDGATFAPLADFFGIDDPGFRGGARAAVGDVTGDGRADLLVAAGVSGGPRVAVFDGTSLAGGAYTRKPVGDFFAFEDTLRNGVYLSAGDGDGDGKAEVFAGGGPGGGPRVSGFSGVDLLAGRQTRVVDFFAGDPADRTGVRVAAKDLDGDSRADLVTGAGRQVATYLGRTLTTAAPTPVVTLDPFPDMVGGVFVG